MAVTATGLEGKITLVLNNGTDAEGNIVTKNKIFQKVKPASTNEDVYLVAAGLSSLQEKSVVSIRRTEEYDLVSV